MPTWQNQQRSGQPTSSEGFHNNKVLQRTSQQNQPPSLSHVSLLEPVQPEDIMAQITEICDLEFVVWP